MSNLQKQFDIAADESNERNARERAINELEAANECDLLAKLVRTSDLDEQYRELALAKLGHPQCETMLETLVESGDLPESLQEQAETLYEETPDNAGAGP